MTPRFKKAACIVIIIIISVMLATITFNLISKSNKEADRINKRDILEKEYQQRLKEAEPDDSDHLPGNYGDVPSISNDQVENRVIISNADESIRDEIGDKIDNSESIKELELGVDNDTSFNGIVLNPKYNGDSKYGYIITCSNGVILTDDTNGFQIYSDEYYQHNNFYIEDTDLLLYNAEYNGSGANGVSWMYTEEISDDEVVDGEKDLIQIRVIDIENDRWIGAYNATVCTENGKYKIAELKSSDITNTKEGIEAIRISDEAIEANRFINLNVYGLTKRRVSVELTNKMYTYRNMDNGWEEIYSGKIPRSMFPMYAVTYEFKEDPGRYVVFYINNGNIQYICDLNFIRARYWAEVEKNGVQQYLPSIEDAGAYDIHDNIEQ